MRFEPKKQNLDFQHPLEIVNKEVAIKIIEEAKGEKEIKELLKAFAKRFID